MEINAHSLFSKWFSESGKLVTKMFNKITEIVEDRSLFVCVLIDEVESLTAARQAAANVRFCHCEVQCHVAFIHAVARRARSLPMRSGS